MARGKFWEKKGNRLTPPLHVLLLFRAAAVSGACGCKRPTQSTGCFGTMHCVHDPNLNISPSRMGEMNCIKPVHWLFLTWALSSVISPGHLLCNANGVPRGPWDELYQFHSCVYPKFSLLIGTWCFEALPEHCSQSVVCLGSMKCLKAVVMQKYFPYPKYIYVFLNI